jgi:hypothetical protein
VFQPAVNAAVYAARNLRRTDMDGNDLGVSPGSVRVLRELVEATGKLPPEVLSALRESGNEAFARELFPDVFGGDAARRRAEVVAGCVVARTTDNGAKPDPSDLPSKAAVMYDPRTRSHYWAMPDGSEVKAPHLPPAIPGAVLERRGQTWSAPPQQAVAAANLEIEKARKSFSMVPRPESDIYQLKWTGDAVRIVTNMACSFSQEQVENAVTRLLDRAGLHSAKLELVVSSSPGGFEHSLEYPR